MSISGWLLSSSKARGARAGGAGQKSGWFYALDPQPAFGVEEGSGPVGKLGGIEFGGATDGERVDSRFQIIRNKVR